MYKYSIYIYCAPWSIGADSYPFRGNCPLYFAMKCVDVSGLWWRLTDNTSILSHSKNKTNALHKCNHKSCIFIHGAFGVHRFRSILQAAATKYDEPGGAILADEELGE